MALNMQNLGAEQETEEELVRRLEYGHLLPFDLNAVVTPTAAIYGNLDGGPLTGVWAKFTGKQVTSLLAEEQDVAAMVGIIVGQRHGQIVIKMGNGFLGWLNPDQYKLVNVIMPELFWNN